MSRMTRMSRVCWIRPIAVIVAVMFLMPLAAYAVVIPDGFDFFQTEPETQVLPLLPGGFFGEKNGTPSDPFEETIDLQGFPGPNLLFPFPDPFPPFQQIYRTTWLDTHGNEVGPHSLHKVRQIDELVEPFDFDTIVHRTGPATLTNVGDTADIPIEIVWLSLMSTEPIQVTFGEEPPSSFDVFVGLSESFPQLTGMKKLTATVAGGKKGNIDLGTVGDAVDTTLGFGPNNYGLPVVYDVIFIDHDDPDNRFRVNNVLSVFHNQSGSFEVVPEVSALLLLCTGLAGLLGYGWHRRRDPEA